MATYSDKVLIASCNIGYALCNYLFFKDNSWISKINYDKYIEIPQLSADKFDPKHPYDLLFNNIITQTILRSGYISSLMVTHPDRFFTPDGAIEEDKMNQLATDINFELFNAAMPEDLCTMSEQLTSTALYMVAMFSNVIIENTNKLIKGIFNEKDFMSDVDNTAPHLHQIFATYFDTTRMLIEAENTSVPMSFSGATAC